MIAYGSGDDDDEADIGDFTPGIIEQATMSMNLKIFRYDPLKLNPI